MVVGWYHSHPGFGCWLSSVDINTQQASRFPNSFVAWHLHAHVPTLVVRTTRPSLCRRGGGSHPVRQGQSCDRRFPSHQSQLGRYGPRASANHLQHWPHQQALHPILNSRLEPTLLQHCGELSKDAIGAGHAHESAQAELDRGTQAKGLQSSPRD